MLQKMTRTNEKGFTLIELMIVIAIIGILAAIAIPNFISYRNKAFCSGAESDADTIAAAISNYFAVPTHTALPTLAQVNITANSLSNKNTATLSGAANGVISITVTDASGRCPADYKAGKTVALAPNGFWAGNIYTKLINP
jgi:type IV pilus assembly protein PilA